MAPSAVPGLRFSSRLLNLSPPFVRLALLMPDAPFILFHPISLLANVLFHAVLRNKGSI